MVVGEGVLILPDVAETIIGHKRYGAAAATAEVMVVDQPAGSLVGIPMGVRPVEAAVHHRDGRIVGIQRVGFKNIAPVSIVGEGRPKVDRIERVGFPLYAEICAHVVAAVEGVGCRTLARIRIGEQIVAHLALEGSAVGMAVHHVAAHAEDFLVSDVEIHSERLGVIDALVTAEPAEAVAVTVGESEFIGVVGRTDECASGIVGISQGHDVQTNTMIYAALPEFYAILALVAALMV